MEASRIGIFGFVHLWGDVFEQNDHGLFLEKQNLVSVFQRVGSKTSVRQIEIEIEPFQKKRRGRHGVQFRAIEQYTSSGPSSSSDITFNPNTILWGEKNYVLVTEGHHLISYRILGLTEFTEGSAHWAYVIKESSLVSFWAMGG